MSSSTVLIVDDEPLFGELLCRILSAEPGLDVIGVVRDGDAAVQLAKKTAPDVVLMDIELSGELDGIAAATLIKQERPETGVVILSAHNDRRYVTSLPMEQYPGWAYLLKQTVPDIAALVRAIHGSIMGMVVLDPAVVMNLRPRQGSAVARLTPRQREVLELIAQGYNNAAIARQLTLAEKSVETYINAIYQEFRLSSEEGINVRVRATLLYLEDSRNR